MADKPAKKKTAATSRTPAEKSKAFQELATTRVNKAIKAIKQIRYLTNVSTYSYTPQEVASIVNTLQSSLDELTAAFKDPKIAKSEGFKLG
jgi:hypothetical protein